MTNEQNAALPERAPVSAADALSLAMRFHETYERLAPSFGYETRTETRAFDPTTPNGRLMIAVCGELLKNATPAPPAPTPAEARGAGGAMRDALERVVSDVDSNDYNGELSVATYDAVKAALAAADGEMTR